MADSTVAGAPPSPTTIAEMEHTGFKVVHVYDITVKLPKTSTGKSQKYMLREKEWTGHARRVQG